MLDRYIELAFAANATMEEPDELFAAAREEAKKKKQQEPIYHTRLKQCLREVSKEEYRCALQASTADEWEACVD